ncbi:MAG: homocysteine S-methyltransferase family protein [Lachnospiraceae bacterium]|nr:homocysteine S-methyltransferase family protein [Lachnospiraceae bacterium]
MIKLLDYMRDHLVYLDGGTGTLLQERGLLPGEEPERWNLTHPEEIAWIGRAYYDAGSNIVLTNTLGANSLNFSDEELSRIVFAAVENTRRAKELSAGAQEKYIGLDIGSLGKLLKPYGDLDFEEAVAIYARTVRLGAEAGADLIFIETMNDSYDTRAAVLAAKENCTLPVFASNAYGADGKLMTGADPAAMVAMLEGLGVDALGANCSLGPKELKEVVSEYLRTASVLVLVKPNAGLPESKDGKTYYNVDPEEFSEDVAEFARMGARLIGGCCGTTPEYIRRLVEKTKDIVPRPVTDKGLSVISSYTHAVTFGKDPVLIGERINPTGKKRFKEALRNEEIDYILKEGLRQEENGAQVLDVNVGIPEIDEPVLLKRVCEELQAVTALPLQIDTTDVIAMEGALRRYNGKAMINSVNGKEAVMREIFPLVKKYGGLVVCLTLDEDGIPERAEKRVEIARHILEVAAEYGIAKKDLIFDTLAMAVSADDHAALSTIEALRRISTELHCLTSLGVSNVSFGLPNREIVSAAFFNAALENGLSAAILNPNSAEMMKTYYAFRALHGLDPNYMDYIEHIGRLAAVSAQVPAQAPGPSAESGAEGGAAGGRSEAGKTSYNKEAIHSDGTGGDDKQALQQALQQAILKGLKEQAAEAARKLLETEEPLSVVNEQIIPALDTVGQGFEKNTIFLPQLLMSAEASRKAFEEIRRKVSESGKQASGRGKFVIATVHGDVHDIGKNIVKLLLENYGFEVIDLGKDVPKERVVEAVIREQAPLVGLSALMTTTVPAMEKTIQLLRKEAPWARVIVGGAVLTQEYADKIGADHYAKDAMATVRYALELGGEKE